MVPRPAVPSIPGAQIAGARVGRDDDGFVTIQMIAAIALSMLLLTALANVLAVQYARGVVRAALDEGARAGTRVAAADVGRDRCQSQAAAALSQLLGGSLGADIAVQCTVGPERVEATARGSFAGWLPGVPSFPVELAAVAVREVVP